MEESSNIHKISRKRVEESPQFFDITGQLVQRDSNNGRRFVAACQFFSFDLSKVFVASQGKQILRLCSKCYVLLIRMLNTIIKTRLFK